MNLYLRKRYFNSALIIHNNNQSVGYDNLLMKTDEAIAVLAGVLLCDLSLCRSQINAYYLIMSRICAKRLHLDTRVAIL